MRFLPAAITQNWTLKLVALVLAVLLWLFVRVDVPSREALSGVPVDIVIADEEWLLASDPEPGQVQVTFSGSTGSLLRLVTEPPRVQISLDAVGGTDTVLAITRENVLFPPDAGLLVENIEPASVLVSMERVLTRFFPFQVATIGSLPSNLALTALPVAAPTRGRVQGAASAVDELQRIPLEPVDLSLLTGSGRVAAAIDAEAMDGFTVTPSDVEVVFRLENSVDRTFDNVPVVIEGGSGLVSDPEFVGVTLHGGGISGRGARPLRLAGAGAGSALAGRGHGDRAPGRGPRGSSAGHRHGNAGQRARAGSGAPGARADDGGGHAQTHPRSGNELRRNVRRPAARARSQIARDSLAGRPPQIYGGVVPELAARAHLSRVDAVVEAAAPRGRCDSRGRGPPSPSRQGPDSSERCWWAWFGPRRSPMGEAFRSLASITWRPICSLRCSNGPS